MLPVCPAGTFYSNNEGACLAYPVKEIVSISAEVDLIPVASCVAANNSGNNGGGGEEGAVPTEAGGCPAQTCSIGSWDTTLCCCYDSILQICY
jgi:hypothetical protein